VDLLGVGTAAAAAAELAIARPKVARKVVLLGSVPPEGWNARSRLPLIKQELLDVPDATPQQVQLAEGKLVSRLLEFLA
jgi:hypothetical protein